MISDNSLIASEVGSYLHNLRRGKRGYFALKLDMSKAYDKVKGSFLGSMMVKLGIAASWIDVVMNRVSSQVMFLLSLMLLVRAFGWHLNLVGPKSLWNVMHCRLCRLLEASLMIPLPMVYCLRKLRLGLVLK